MNLLGNGFIIAAILWGAATAELIDRRFRASALYLFSDGRTVLPIRRDPFSNSARDVRAAVARGILAARHLAAAYLVAALTIAVSKFVTSAGAEDVAAV